MDTASTGGHQTRRYGPFYATFGGARWFFRYDVQYRSKRLPQVAKELGLTLEGGRVLEVGFGRGDLLACLPRSCRLLGAEISESAVQAARTDPRFEAFASAEFVLIPENGLEGLPEGPFDVALSSHVLEHVPHDGAHLAGLHQRLRPGGLLFVFVPLEVPGYNPDHERTYCPSCITEKVRQAGFGVLHWESSLHMAAKFSPILTLPSRRRWPILGPLADAVRLTTLSMMPYPLVRATDRAMASLGMWGRQALVVARR